jgi:hypothetical protein
MKLLFLFFWLVYSFSACRVKKIGLTQSAIQPSAERYFLFFCVSVFALAERKNRHIDKTGSAMLPQAKKVVARSTAYVLTMLSGGGLPPPDAHAGMGSPGRL